MINELLNKYLADKKLYQMKKSVDWGEQKKQISFDDIVKQGMASIKDFHIKDYEFNQPKEIFISNNLLKGNLAFELGAYKRALDHFKIVLEKDPENKEAWFKVGLTYFLLRHFKGALGCFNKILSFTPELNYALILKGIILEELGNKEEAKKYYERALFSDLIDADLIMAFDTVIFSYINTQNKVLEIFDDYIKKYPKKLLLLYKKGLILYNLERFDEALSCLNALLKYNPNYIAALFTEANIFEELEKFDDALTQFDKILKYDPENHRAWFLKGNLLSRLEQKEQALECFNKAIELKSDYVDALNNKGLILQDLLKLEEALEIFNKAIEIDPLYHLAYFNKACVLKQLNQNVEAIKHFDKVIELNEFDIDSYYNKACLLKDQDKFKEAINNYKKVLELDSEDIEALLGMGVAYVNLENYPKALDCMDKALKIDPDHKEVLKLKEKIKELEKLSPK
ncbi:MAG: tetratricopeptide repeat protein [Candidatus Hodarchaeota archaeon]